jgi:hypothetical protein
LLEELFIESNKSLTIINSLDGLEQLQRLIISGNKSLTKLPSFNSLKRLEGLSIESNDSLTELPYFDSFGELEKLIIDINNGKVTFAPRDWCSNNMTDEICAQKLIDIINKVNEN